MNVIASEDRFAVSSQVKDDFLRALESARAFAKVLARFQGASKNQEIDARIRQLFLEYVPELAVEQIDRSGESEPVPAKIKEKDSSARPGMERDTGLSSSSVTQADSERESREQEAMPAAEVESSMAKRGFADCKNSHRSDSLSADGRGIEVPAKDVIDNVDDYRTRKSSVTKKRLSMKAYVLELLRDNELHIEDLQNCLEDKEFDVNEGSLSVMLSRMYSAGLVKKLGRGVYALAE